MRLYNFLGNGLGTNSLLEKLGVKMSSKTRGGSAELSKGQHYIFRITIFRFGAKLNGIDDFTLLASQWLHYIDLTDV